MDLLEILRNTPALVPEDVTDDEPILEPPKRWRNKFRALQEHKDAAQGLIKRGQIIWSSFIWPSKEVAEQKHTEWLSAGGTPCGYVYVPARGWSKWLGAFPVED
jgi:hypothetical protein